MQSTSQFSPSRLFQNAVLELLGLYWAGDLIVLLFCAWQILSGIHICHKSKLTHYMRLKSGTRMTKIRTKAFSHRDTDDCALAFTGVTWNIWWATCRKQLPGMGMPWQLKHGYHLFAFCSRGLVEDKTKQESRYHKLLKFVSGYTPYIAVLYSRVMWFARLGQQSYGKHRASQ